MVIVHKVNQPTASACIWLLFQIAKLRQITIKCYFINGKNILCTYFPNHSIKLTYYKQTSQVKLRHNVPIIITVYVERFAELTIQGFSSMKFFVGILMRCLGHPSQLFDYNKIFTGKLLLYCWKPQSLAQQIFPHI